MVAHDVSVHEKPHWQMGPGIDSPGPCVPRAIRSKNRASQVLARAAILAVSWAAIPSPCAARTVIGQNRASSTLIRAMIPVTHQVTTRSCGWTASSMC